MTSAVILLVAVIVTLAAVALRIARYERHFAYSARDELHHGFDPQRMRSVSVSIEGDNLLLPEEVAGNQLLVLEVEVTATWTGSLFDPAIQWRRGAFSGRTYYRRGSKGRRYLLIDAVDDDATCSLRGVHLRVHAGEARIWLCPRPDINGNRWILAPHADDAELAAFSLYGPRTWVTTVTASEVGTVPVPGHAPRSLLEALARANIRSIESRAVPGFGGVPFEHTHTLGYYDGTLAEMAAQPDTPARSSVLPLNGSGRHRRAARETGESPTWRTLVEDLAALLREIQPTVIVAPHPILDQHADHRFTTLALFEALSRTVASAANPTLLLYSNHPWGKREGRASLAPVGPRHGLVGIHDYGVDEVLYSYPASIRLDERALGLKQVAIESMSDLRTRGPTDDRWYTQLRRTIGSLAHPWCTYDAGYHRRNIRPNEFFYAIAPDQVAHFHARFRGALAAHTDTRARAR